MMLNNTQYNSFITKTNKITFTLLVGVLVGSISYVLLPYVGSAIPAIYIPRPTPVIPEEEIITFFKQLFT